MLYVASFSSPGLKIGCLLWTPQRPDSQARDEQEMCERQQMTMVVATGVAARAYLESMHTFGITSEQSSQGYCSGRLRPFLWQPATHVLHGSTAVLLGSEEHRQLPKRNGFRKSIGNTQTDRQEVVTSSASQQDCTDASRNSPCPTRDSL